MSIAFLYSGQGSQKAGMGKDFYSKYEVFKNIFNKLNQCVDFDLKERCFSLEKSSLNKTMYTQPCLVAFQIAITDLLKSFQIYPEYVAGISLGEYAALYTSGVWNSLEAMKIVSARGIIMEQEASKINGKSCSIIGLDDVVVKKICSVCDSVEIAGYYCKGNITIAGREADVDKAVSLAKSKGAKYCIDLKSKYPFHTALFKNAGDIFYRYLVEQTMKEMKIPVVFNYTGKTVGMNENILELLKNQMCNCIKFEKTIQYMENLGVDRIIEIGPVKVNSKIIERVTPNIKTSWIGDIYSLENFLKRDRVY